MDDITRAWDQWTGLVSDNLATVAGVGLAVVLLLVLAVLVARRRRADQLIVLPEPDHGLVRRPKYLDDVVLSDALAHLEANDHSSGLRGVLEGDAETAEERETTRRTDRVRALNKAIEAARRRADLATVVSSDKDELPEAGKVIEAHGRLRVLPATHVADLLFRAQPLLTGQTALPDDTPGVTAEGALLTRHRTDAAPSTPPIVAAVEMPQGRLYTVLEGSAIEGRVRDGDMVRILAILDRPLDKREKVEPDDYLSPHLPGPIRSATRDRDLLDVAVPLAEAAGHKLSRKDLVERGPGAVVTTAALW